MHKYRQFSRLTCESSFVQPAMGEMLDAVSNAATNNGKCLILFPAEDAITFNEIKMDVVAKRDVPVDPQYADDDEGWDVVVIDGTWSQARKIHSKYFPEDSGGCLYRVQLSQDAVYALDADANSQNTVKGHQLRRHPIKVSNSARSLTFYTRLPSWPAL